MPPVFDIRVFVDNSLVEIFVGDAVVLTRRVYDGTPTTLTLPSHLEARGFVAHALTAL